jgi:hypothetical protein
MPEYGALQQRAAQDLAGQRQAIEEFFARTRGLLMCHFCK